MTPAPITTVYTLFDALIVMLYIPMLLSVVCSCSVVKCSFQIMCAAVVLMFVE